MFIRGRGVHDKQRSKVGGLLGVKLFRWHNSRWNPVHTRGRAQNTNFIGHFRIILSETRTLLCVVQLKVESGKWSETDDDMRFYHLKKKQKKKKKGPWVFLEHAGNIPGGCIHVVWARARAHVCVCNPLWNDLRVRINLVHDTGI